jgi:hypothetical protein
MFAVKDAQKQNQGPVFGNRKTGIDSDFPSRSRIDPALLYQRSLGNAYFTSVAQGNQSFAQPLTVMGEPRIQRACACDDKEDELQRIQTKLAINRPGDRYEREADRIAEQVMRMPEASFEREFEGLNSDMSIERISPSDSSPLSPTLGIVRDQSSGQSLSPSTKEFMEGRFGVDFGHVRLHTDVQAHRAASEIHARAFTYGHHIWLGRGETDQNMKLMAHELTHVIQQHAPNVSHSIQRQLIPPMPIVTQPIPTLTDHPVEVNAVDAREETATEWYKPWRYTGPLAWFFRGDVKMTNVASMVTNVITFLNGRRMLRLNIMDHGNENGLEIGNDWLASSADVARYSGVLGRLRSHFAPGAIVHMQNCHTGQNRTLICALARAFGTPVYAGTGSHNPVLGFNFGDYVRCDPSGAFNPNVGRPETPLPPRMANNDQVA